MKIQTILYYRYLFRQTFVMLISTLIIALVICLVFTLYPILGYVETIIISSLIWILPAYSLIIELIWFFKYIISKRQLKDLELFLMIKNDRIRKLVLRSGKKIKYLIPIQNQDKDFFEAIKSEIEKQKKLLAIKKGEYK